MRKFFYLFGAFLLILSSCKDYLPGFNFKSFNKTPAEELAKEVKNENLGRIEEIVKLNRNLIDYLDPKFGHSLLMLAVANNLENSVAKLLELGANPNLRSKISQEEDSSYVDTPLFIACDNSLIRNSCRLDILKSIIEHGGNLNDKIEIKFKGADYITHRTPLLTACGGSCLEVVKLLVESGANLNNYDYAEGNGPITKAIIQDRMEILRYLIIDRKASIPKYCFVVDAHNETPRKTYTVTEFLLKRNYDKYSENYGIRKEILEYLRANNLK